MNSKRVWIYCRTAYPNEFSLTNQEMYLTAYAREQGFIIVDVTSECGSGLDFSRDRLKVVSHAIETGTANALLVQSLSRLSRDMEGTVAYLRWLEKNHATLICTDGTSSQTYMDTWQSLIGWFEHTHRATS